MARSFEVVVRYQVLDLTDEESEWLLSDALDFLEDSNFDFGDAAFESITEIG